MIVSILLIIACACSLIAISIMALRKNNSNAIAVILSAIGILTSFVALSLSAPRDISGLCPDYLGIIVAILAIITTLLLGMQLYHALNLKEDAKSVKEAKKFVEKYAPILDQMPTQIKNLEDQYNALRKHIDSLGKYVDNPEWIYAITDAKDHFLFGIKRADGAIDWSVGVPGPIKKELDELRKEIDELKKKK